MISLRIGGKGFCRDCGRCVRNKQNNLCKETGQASVDVDVLKMHSEAPSWRMETKVYGQKEGRFVARVKLKVAVRASLDTIFLPWVSLKAISERVLFIRSCRPSR